MSNARNLELREGSRLLAGIGEGMGAPGAVGGDIEINATAQVTLSGENSQGFASGIFNWVEEDAQGTAGGITIDTGFLSLRDGAQLNASTFGGGNAGVIAITAADAITLSGENSQGLSGIFSTVAPGAQGNSGGITIDTGSLSLTDGAQLGASTFGGGNAGAIAQKQTKRDSQPS